MLGIRYNCLDLSIDTISAFARLLLFYWWVITYCAMVTALTFTAGYSSIPSLRVPFTCKSHSIALFNLIESYLA